MRADYVGADVVDSNSPLTRRSNCEDERQQWVGKSPTLSEFNAEKRPLKLRFPEAAIRH